MSSTFPRFRGKWRHRAIVNPKEFLRRYYPDLRAPRRCLVVWNPRLAERLAERFRGARVPALAPFYVVPGGESPVGLVCPRGVGAPTTITQCEELAAAGTREFLGVGTAGGLSPSLASGEVVVCDGAVRDEGTSHHYAPAHVPARPSPTLRRWVERTLERAGVSFRVGPSWTTDAPYRETVPELRHYRSRGVLTVEMEASAMFLFGRARRVQVASVFVISDHLTDRGWDPRLHEVTGRLEDVAAAVLGGSLSSPGSRSARGGTPRAGSTGVVRRGSPRSADRSRSRS